jgi:hypothetical protein
MTLYRATPRTHVERAQRLVDQPRYREAGLARNAPSRRRMPGASGRPQLDHRAAVYGPFDKERQLAYGEGGILRHGAAQHPAPRRWDDIS